MRKKLGRFEIKSDKSKLILSKCLGIREEWDSGPETSTGGTPGPGTWDLDPKMFMGNLGPETPKYSTRNTLHFICYKTLH